MATYTTTTKHQLRKLTGANLVSDIDAGFTALASDLDALIAIAVQGPASSLPTSTGGSPGKLGRWYWATDTLVLSFDYGTGWVVVYEKETWKTINATGGSSPAFGTGWANQGGAAATAAYARGNGIVRLRGSIVQSSAPSSNSTMFTLPAGYRPAATLSFAVAGLNTVTLTGAPAIVTVGADGVVKQQATSQQNLSLDTVSFRAEQ